MARTGDGQARCSEALVVSPARAGSQTAGLPARVSALGRLAPESEVIAVAPPTPTGAMSGARVERLLVAVGDHVAAGQTVAILDTYRGRAASLRRRA